MIYGAARFLLPIGDPGDQAVADTRDGLQNMWLAGVIVKRMTDLVDRSIQ